MVQSVMGKGQQGNKFRTITAIWKSVAGVTGSVCTHHDLLVLAQLV